MTFAVEELGFDKLWPAEHHFTDYAACPDNLQLLSWLAGRTERIELGTHFAAPTEDAIVVSEELVRRWGLPKWRYVNSGSEATMDAIRIARGLTGRDTIVKIAGSYHGHHDGVMVAIGSSTS